MSERANEQERGREADGQSESCDREMERQRPNEIEKWFCCIY